MLTGWLFNKYWINRRLLSTKETLNGKTVLITGGNCGIGYETAKDLLKRNARVIIACRNLNKGHQAVENLLNETNCSRNQIVLMECDLASLNSVRNFVDLYMKNEERLDILICNAGLGYSSDRMTEDGFDYVIQSNYLGHFLLTNLLLEKLKQSKPSRILYISSDLHQSVQSIDWSDAFTQHKRSNFMGSYPASKLFQILSTYKLKQIDPDINAFALTPGFVSTSIKDPMEESVGFFTSFLYYPFISIMKFLFAKTPENGAQTSIYCAIEPKLQYSKELYFQNCAVCKSSSLSTDPIVAEQLWKLSCQAVGLDFTDVFSTN